jgi:glycosyltransferase involved in cell wall biosynthesis
MKKISVLLPTRGRPLFMERVVTSAMEKANNPNSLQFVFYIDNDDELSKEKIEELVNRYDENSWQEDFATIKYIIGERIVLSQMWNECFKLADADVVMHCGDDIIFQTTGWDDVVLNQFDAVPDKIAFVYGRDGVHHMSFGTHGFIHRNWVKATGGLFKTMYSSDYNDTYLNHVSEMIGRKFFVEIYTEHMHPAVGKYMYDQTHKDRLERHFADNVQQLYESTLHLRQEDAALLRKFIDSYNNG